MKRLKNSMAYFWCTVFILWAAWFSGCGGGGGGSSAPAAQTVRAGSVVMGAVTDARVFADLNGNRVWDVTEAFAFTDATGAFELTLPAGNYLVATEGGIDLLTGLPAIPMLAPKNAGNVSLVTTLVALDPSVKDAIEAATGASYDADLAAAAGVDADLLKLARAVETILATFDNAGFGAAAQQEVILETMSADLAASGIETAPDFNATLAASLETAVITAALAVSADSPVPIDETTAGDLADAVGAAVDEIATAVDAGAVGGVVDEADVQEDIATAVDNLEDNVDVIDIPTAGIEVASIDGFNGSDVSVLDNIGSSYTATDDMEVVEVVLSATNDYGEAVPYTASISLALFDQNNSRQTNLTITNLGVTIGAEGVDSTLTMDDSAALFYAYGVSADGLTVVNLETPIEGPFENIGFVDNTITFDLVRIEELLVAQVSSEFGDIVKQGSYNLALFVDGAPASDMVVDLEVTAAP